MRHLVEQRLAPPAGVLLEERVERVHRLGPQEEPAAPGADVTADRSARAPDSVARVGVAGPDRPALRAPCRTAPRPPRRASTCPRRCRPTSTVTGARLPALGRAPAAPQGSDPTRNPRREARSGRSRAAAGPCQGSTGCRAAVSTAHRPCPRADRGSGGDCASAIAAPIVEPCPCRSPRSATRTSCVRCTPRSWSRPSRRTSWRTPDAMADGLASGAIVAMVASVADDGRRTRRAGRRRVGRGDVRAAALVPGGRTGRARRRSRRHVAEAAVTTWRADLDPLVVLAEIEDPALHAASDAHGDPAARERFYLRRGARRLPIAVRAALARAGPAARARDAAARSGGAAVRRRARRRVARCPRRRCATSCVGYYTRSEGAAPDDAQAVAMLAPLSDVATLVVEP